MHPSTKNAFEDIDAAFFSGDTFHNKDAIEKAEYYIGRWTREIESIKKHDQYYDWQSNPIIGKELTFAAKNNLPIFYMEKYHSPGDEHMNFFEKVTMTPAPAGYYIGNSDINPEEWGPDERVGQDFDEGFMAIYKVEGIKYQ